MFDNSNDETAAPFVRLPFPRLMASIHQIKLLLNSISSLPSAGDSRMLILRIIAAVLALDGIRSADAAVSRFLKKLDS